MRVVFDSSVWIAAVGSSKGYASQTTYESYLSSKIEIFISPIILDEISENLEKKFHFENELAQKYAQEARNLCNWEINISPQETAAIKFARDLKDRHILALCRKIKADYLITFDRKHLLPLGKFGKTKILEPKDFAKILANF